MSDLRETLEQAVKQMLADGKTDTGFALLGPDKKGTHTLIGAAAVTAVVLAVHRIRKRRSS